MNEEQKIPEKYISIEYDTWVNKYKPLEEENNHLKQRLQEASILININVNEIYSRASRSIGYVLIEVDKPKIVIEDYQWIFIEDQIKRVVANRMSSFTLTKEYAVEYVNRIEAAKLYMDEQVVKIKKIPSILRWLFSIKTTSSIFF